MCRSGSRSGRVKGGLLTVVGDVDDDGVAVGEVREVVPPLLEPVGLAGRVRLEATLQLGPRARLECVDLGEGSGVLGGRVGEGLEGLLEAREGRWECGDGQLRELGLCGKGGAGCGGWCEGLPVCRPCGELDGGGHGAAGEEGHG